MKILLSSYLQKPAHVCFNGEDDDENVVLFLRRHFITNLVWIVLALFMICVPTLLTNLFASNNITLIEDLICLQDQHFLGRFIDGRDKAFGIQ